MDDRTDAQSETWMSHYDHACEELGYEPNEAWRYADRELGADIRAGRI